jgi:predicted HNH restriction endonuclease
MNNWWRETPTERFWLELTDRDDIGVDLRAPLLDDSGNDNWRYSLFRHARVGDIVLHYKKPALIGFSRIAGRSVPGDITWAARGSYARSKGTQPHARPGYRIPLTGITPLKPPVSLADLRARRRELEKLIGDVSKTHKGSLYLPFELSASRDLRMLQGYAFKVPASFIELLPSLAGAASLAANTTSGEPVADVAATDHGRNPPWGRDELILALDLYVASGAAVPSKSSNEVGALSDLLTAMGRALGRADAETYRNRNGVYMKLMNFRRLDPAFTDQGKIGLTRGNKDEETVWQEFANDTSRLVAVANAIRAAVLANQESGVLNGTDEPEIQEAEEGRVLTRIHRVRERDRKLVAACKKQALKIFGKLTCAACDFDFLATYGPVAQGLVEVHHTKPLHTLVAGSKTKVDDLALLCANCHRVVHSSRRWLTVEQVRALLQDRMPARKVAPSRT